MKRRKPASLEDYLIMACVLLLLGYVLFILMTGCAAKQAQKMQMIWLDNECFLYIDGMEAEQAEELQKDWSMERCDIAVKSKAGQKEAPATEQGDDEG